MIISSTLVVRSLVVAASCGAALAGSGCKQVDDALGAVTLAKFDTSMGRIEPATGAYQSLPAPPTRREIHQDNLAVSGSKLLVIGGIDEHLKSPGTVDVFDTTTGAWSVGAPWPNPRWLLGMTPFVGQLCFLAGTAGLSVGKLDNRFDCYDPIANTWSSRAPQPGEGSTYAAVLGSKLYAVTAEGVGAERVNKGYVYDSAADTWTGLPTPPLECASTSARLIGSQGKVYAIGCNGEPGSVSPSDRIHAQVFDVAAATWKILPVMPVQPTTETQLTLLGGRVAYLDGTSIALLTATESAWEAPMPQVVNAASRIGGLMGDTYYAVISATPASGSQPAKEGSIFKFDIAGGWMQVSGFAPTLTVGGVLPAGGALYVIGDFGTAQASTH